MINEFDHPGQVRTGWNGQCEMFETCPILRQVVFYEKIDPGFHARHPGYRANRAEPITAVNRDVDFMPAAGAVEADEVMEHCEPGLNEV